MPRTVRHPVPPRFTGRGSQPPSTSWWTGLEDGLDRFHIALKLRPHAPSKQRKRQRHWTTCPELGSKWEPAAVGVIWPPIETCMPSVSPATSQTLGRVDIANHGGLMRCDVAELNRRLRRDIHSPHGYERSIDLVRRGLPALHVVSSLRDDAWTQSNTLEVARPRLAERAGFDRVKIDACRGL